MAEQAASVATVSTTAARSWARPAGARASSSSNPAPAAASAPREKLRYVPGPSVTPETAAAARSRLARRIAGNPYRQDEADRRHRALRVPVRERLFEPARGGAAAAQLDEVGQQPLAQAVGNHHEGAEHQHRLEPATLLGRAAVRARR